VPLSCNLRTLTSWKPLGHSRLATGLLYLFGISLFFLFEIKLEELSFGGQNRSLKSDPRVRETHIRVGRDRKVSLNIWGFACWAKWFGVVLALSAERGEQSSLRNGYFSFYRKNGLWIK
jgi:hypothetical protein